MKGSLSSLRVLALAETILDHATIAEAEQLIEACKGAIDGRKRKRHSDLHAFAISLIPELVYVSVLQEFGLTAIEYCFLATNRGNWTWWSSDTTPITASASAERIVNANPDGWKGISPTFTLETHMKIMEYIANY